MREYLRDWEKREQVYIPPVKKKGFYENIIIRTHIPAKEQHDTESYIDDESTVLLDDEETVLLESED